jgi:hypothetical protein
MKTVSVSAVKISQNTASKFMRQKK